MADNVTKPAAFTIKSKQLAVPLLIFGYELEAPVTSGITAIIVASGGVAGIALKLSIQLVTLNQSVLTVPVHTRVPPGDDAVAIGPVKVAENPVALIAKLLISINKTSPATTGIWAATAGALPV